DPCCAPVRRLRPCPARGVRATPIYRFARCPRCNPLHRRRVMARPPSNTPASLLRGAVTTDWDSPLAPLRTAAERIVRESMAPNDRGGTRIQALGTSPSAYHGLARDFPEVFGLRDNRPGPKKE